MKEIKDWRNWIKFILTAGGVISLLFACGDPDPDMTIQRWLTSLLLFLAVSAACFGVLYIIIRQDY